jgi:membrane protein implicated in regulation of membrane protease activity
LLRFTAIPGRLAHLVSSVTNGLGNTQRPSPTPKAGWARWPIELVVVAILAVGLAYALFNAAEGTSNQKPTDYTVAQLVKDPAVGSRVYATVGGYLHEWYVEDIERASGKLSKAWYLIGDGENDAWIIVESNKTADEIYNLAGSDGSVTFTGMLRTDHGEVGDAIKELGANVPSRNISSAILLKEGQTPANSMLMFGLAAVFALLAILIFVGWTIGYVLFRPSKGGSGITTGGMTEAIPVAVTGLVPGFTGGKRALQMKASLQVPAADPAAPPATPTIDLVWTANGQPAGLRLIPGTSEAVVGNAYPLSGARPALRIKFDKFKLTLSFDSAEARDQAFDQFKLTAGLNPSGDGAAATA